MKRGVLLVLLKLRIKQDGIVEVSGSTISHREFS
jgi:hypothetical protein